MDPNAAKKSPKRDPEFPQIGEIHAYDKATHIRKAMEAGLTREQAERHAEEHFEGRARMEGQTTEEATEQLREEGVRNPDYD